MTNKWLSFMPYSKIKSMIYIYKISPVKIFIKKWTLKMPFSELIENEHFDTILCWGLCKCTCFDTILCWGLSKCTCFDRFLCWGLSKSTYCDIFFCKGLSKSTYFDIIPCRGFSKCTCFDIIPCRGLRQNTENKFILLVMNFGISMFVKRNKTLYLWLYMRKFVSGINKLGTSSMTDNH